MQVFVSYSHVDRDTATRVAELLTKKGITFFLDERSMQWGERVDESIFGAFDTLTHLIVLLSPASIKSQWVAYEIGLARGRGVQILPFLMHPSIEVPSFIAGLNYKSDFTQIEDYFTAATANEKPASIDRELRIAVIPKGESLEFWKFVKSGALRSAQELGRVTVNWKDQFRESDTAGQNLAINECIYEGYDGVCVAAIHATETRRAIDRVIAAGIPVVLYDSGLEDETNIVSYVATDNYSAGQRAGHKMAELLGNQGSVAIVRYKTGSRSTEERERGFLDSIEGYADIRPVAENFQISDDDRVIATVTNSILERYGDRLDGVFCPIEFATRGMLRALQDYSGDLDMSLIGFDASPTILAALRAGKLNALISQDPFQIGALSVQAMVDHLLGKPVDKVRKVSCAVVTVENVDKPYIRRILTMQSV
jgi:ribose transport system substrate-binding protein